MKRIRTVEDFLGTLKDVCWTKADGNKSIKGDAHNNDVEFSLQTKFASSFQDIELMPIQVIAYIYINGKMVTFWGSEGSSDNYKLVKFFLDRKYLATTFESNVANATEEHAEHVWKTYFLGE